MLKVVIADDEELTREGMRQFVPWKNYNIDLVGCAADGLEALELVRSTGAQVVITDIRMPDMDGLQLIQALTEEKAKVLVVIISAYGEFEYAQQALKYKIVSDYLLKPVIMDNFCELLSHLEANWNDMYGKSDSIRWLQGDVGSLSLEENEKTAKMIQKLVKHVRNGMYDDALEIAETIPLNYGSGTDIDLQLAKRTVWELSLQIELTLAEMGFGRPSAEKKQELLANINQVKTEAEVREICVLNVEKALFVVSPTGAHKMSPLTRALYKLMKENYMDPDFHLGEAAEKLRVSPNYLSARLKLETGSSFLKALNNIRCDYAKELLADETSRVSEVCYQVGFNDPRYFARVFKRTPDLHHLNIKIVYKHKEGAANAAPSLCEKGSII